MEFALILPVFLLILAGILDYGFMLNARVTLVNAAREGARVAVGMADNPTVIPATVSNMVRANVPGLTSTSPTLTVATNCIPDTSKHGSCDFSGGVGALVPGDSVRVVTTYTYRSFFASLFGSTVALGNQVQMVIEDRS